MLLWVPVFIALNRLDDELEYAQEGNTEALAGAKERQSVWAAVLVFEGVASVGLLLVTRSVRNARARTGSSGGAPTAKQAVELKDAVQRSANEAEVERRGRGGWRRWRDRMNAYRSLAADAESHGGKTASVQFMPLLPLKY